MKKRQEQQWQKINKENTSHIAPDPKNVLWVIGGHHGGHDWGQCGSFSGGNIVHADGHVYEFVCDMVVCCESVIYFLSITFLILIPNPSCVYTFSRQQRQSWSWNIGMSQLDNNFQHLSKHFASHVGHEMDKRKKMDMIGVFHVPKLLAFKVCICQLHFSWAACLGKPVVELPVHQDTWFPGTCSNCCTCAAGHIKNHEATHSNRNLNRKQGGNFPTWVGTTKCCFRIVKVKDHSDTIGVARKHSYAALNNFFPQLNEAGVEGWKEKNRRQRNKCVQECARGTHQCTGQSKIFVRTSPCPFRLVLVFFVLAGYGSLVCRWLCYNLQRFGMWCCVVVCDVKCNNAAGCDMTWGEVICFFFSPHVFLPR